MKRGLIVWLFITVSVPGDGNATSPQLAAVGPGTASCAEFARSFRETPELTEAMYYSWAQGFMSASNLTLLLSKQPIHNFAKLSVKGGQSFLRNYCDKHPLVPYELGVEELLKTIPLEPIRAD
jgi:hypothetical protein